jgi:hypothetical protein
MLLLLQMLISLLRASPTNALNFGAIKTVYSVLDSLLGREAMFTSNRSSKSISNIVALNFGAVYIAASAL